MFAERPFTTGKGKLNVGAAFQHTTFSSIGGRPLTDLELSATYASGDVNRCTSSLDVQLDRTIVSATYGLHNKVDIAAIVPFGSARVSGFASYYQVFEGRADESRTDGSGSSFGIGDILLRTKVALIASDSFDAAAAVDIRLPTGDPEKLLGTGFTQARVMFIGGTTLGSVNPHVNVGYTFGGEGMVFGADNALKDRPGPRNSSSGSRLRSSTTRPALISRPHRASPSPATSSGASSGTQPGWNSSTADPMEIGRSVSRSMPGTVHKLLGAVGAKVSVGGAWLLTGTVLFPLNDNGIKPAVTPVIGFERAF